MAMKTFASLLALGLLPSGVAHAGGNAASASGTANSVVVAPLVLSHVGGTALNFGKFTPGNGGSVVITASGSAYTTGGTAFVPGNANQADQFSVTGDAGRNFSIATGNGTVNSGLATMSFTTTPAIASATLSPSGSAQFWVGGTLSVPALQTAGSYAGSYTVTIAYS